MDQLSGHLDLTHQIKVLETLQGATKVFKNEGKPIKIPGVSRYFYYNFLIQIFR